MIPQAGPASTGMIPHRGRLHKPDKAVNPSPSSGARVGNGLPTGVIVGSAAIVLRISDCDHRIDEWRLADVKGFSRPRKPRRMRKPIWLRPL